VQPAGQGTEAGVKKRRVAGKASAAGGARARASKAGSATARAARSPRKVATSGLRITHAERVIDAENNITKGDLVAYYAMVGRLMLPHLADRPVALLRAPQGVTGQKFFQKHADEGSLPGVERLPPELDPEH